MSNEVIQQAINLLEDTRVIYKELWSPLSLAKKEYTANNHTSFESLGIPLFAEIQHNLYIYFGER